MLPVEPLFFDREDDARPAREIRLDPFATQTYQLREGGALTIRHDEEEITLTQAKPVVRVTVQPLDVSR